MLNPNEKIEPINVAEEVSRSFLDYSMSVIISRALPDARDGLKPSQRRILYAMHDLSLFPGRQHRKCAKICGDTSGNYHPHGEAVIYPTLVHMAQPWAMRDMDQCGVNHSFAVRMIISARVAADFCAFAMLSPGEQ